MTTDFIERDPAKPGPSFYVCGTSFRKRGQAADGGAECPGEAVSDERERQSGCGDLARSQAAQSSGSARRSTARNAVTRSVFKCLTRCQTFEMSDI